MGGSRARFQGAQRFQLVAKMMGADENQYLAIYDAESDNPGALMAAMGEMVAGLAAVCARARDDTPRAIADYVAGMTDRYAVRVHRDMFVPHEGPL